MAENKKSFILYTDLIHTVSKLPNEKAGELFKHILEYVNDNDPQTDDLLLQISFEPIKQQLKRDLQKWDGELTKKSEGGALGNLKRWNIDLYNQVINNEIDLQNAINIASSRRASHTDDIPSHTIASVAVNDSVTVNVNETIKSILVDKMENLSSFISKFNLVRKSNFKATSEKLANALNARLKEKYTIEQIISATRNAMREKYHIENKYRHLTPEFMLRQDKLEKYLDQVSAPEEQHLGFYKGKPILESNGRRFIHIGEGVEYVYPPKPDTTGWTEEEKYNYFTCDRYDGYWSDLYKKAMDSQMNTTEKEKRGIYKWFYNQETLRFKEANHRNVRTS